MQALGAVLMTAAVVPLGAAWRANRRTSLRAALAWATAAWAAWEVTTWGEAVGGEALPGLRYLALSLTGSAGVAVLGARRPGVGAWNFVVVGLLVVLLRPLWEGLGELRLREAHAGFLAATVAVPLLNYLPTRLGLAVLTLMAGCGLEMVSLVGWVAPPAVALAAPLMVAGAPWLAWAGLRARRGTTAFDALWLSYRDRFGLVWGQRMREQFNAAAVHAGWPVVLRWRGLQGNDAGRLDPEEAVATLRAVLKRFGPKDADGATAQ